MTRWYDKYEGLGKRIDAFKRIEVDRRDFLIKGIVDLINKHNPELLSPRHAFEYPLELNRRRWYDKDPYLWLLINTLKKAEKELLGRVNGYLEKNQQL